MRRIQAISIVLASLLTGCAGGPDADGLWKKSVQEATTAWQNQDYAHAETSYRAAAEATSHFAAGDIRIGLSWLDLGRAQVKLGHNQDAAASLTRAKQFFEEQSKLQKGGEDARDAGINLAQSLLLLADAECKLSNESDAETYYYRSLDLANANLGSDTLRYDISMHLASLLRKKNRIEEAERLEAQVADVSPSRFSGGEEK